MKCGFELKKCGRKIAGRNAEMELQDLAAEIDALAVSMKE